VALDTASFALTLLTDAHDGLESGPMPTRETMTLVIACTARIFYVCIRSLMHIGKKDAL
jgi:hypothetical protein